MQKSATDNARVSVVIPCYNNKNHVKNTLSSIANQTCPPDELIICDDHSDDGSWRLIQYLRPELEKHFPNLKLIRQPHNKGVSRNINTGLKQSTCEWTSLVAADDRFLPRKIEYELRNALRKNVRVAYSGVSTIDHNGNRIQRWRFRNTPPEGDVFVETVSKNFFRTGIRLFRNLLIHQSVFDRIGYFDTTLDLYEDWDFQIRLTNDFQVAYSGIHGVEYRIHDRGIHQTRILQQHKWQKKVIEKNMHLIDEMEGFLKKKVLKRLNWILISSRLNVLLQDNRYHEAADELYSAIKEHPFNLQYYRLITKHFISNPRNLVQ